MSNYATKQQIRDVLSGKIQIRNGEPIQSIARYLRSSQKANRISQSEQQIKKQDVNFVLGTTLLELRCCVTPNKVIDLSQILTTFATEISRNDNPNH